MMVVIDMSSVLPFMQFRLFGGEGGVLNQEKDTVLHFSSANQQTNKKKKK